MEVSEQERQWALAIKEAATADGEILVENLTDLEFVQHAIVAKSNVKKALLRIRRLQNFKERYGIVLDGSYEQGLRDLQAFHSYVPGFALGFGCENTQDGSQVMSFDFAAYRQSNLKTEEAFKLTMRAFFYVLQVSSSNFTAMRAGVRLFGNCQHLSWQHFNAVNEKRASELYSNCYPMRVVEFAIMQANPLIRFFYTLLKVFLSKKVANSFCFPPDRDAYLKQGGYDHNVVPHAWGGTLTLERVVSNYRTKLWERYKNAEEFTL